MNVINAVYPNEEQMVALAEPGPAQPIHMVNLLRFRDRAEYADGRESGLSGREAYNLYAQQVSQLIEEFGGHIEFLGDVTRLAIGEVEELWDEIAIAVYPSRSAMLAMIASEQMQAIGEHRAANLAGQLNIETIVPGERAP